MIYVLDTNVLIEIETGNKEIASKLANLSVHASGPFHITSPVYSEFYYGYLNKSEVKQNAALEHLRVYGLLNTTTKSSTLFAQLKKSLEDSGKHIPLMDLLTASIVMSAGATLVTRDTHFKSIEGLSVVVL